jgi:membrane-associated phospholipid phosphatase
VAKHFANRSGGGIDRLRNIYCRAAVVLRIKYMGPNWKRYFCGLCFLALFAALNEECKATPQEQKAGETASGDQKSDANSKPPLQDSSSAPSPDPHKYAGDNKNPLGLPFLRNLATDQKAIWTSPRNLSWADGIWLFPLAGVTTGAFYTDRAAARGVTNDPVTLQRYRNISNYGLGAMMGVGAGAYILGRMSHDDHKRETGVLAAEAVADTLAVNTAFKYSFGRERPYVDDGRGQFFQGGDSFASDHATAAWAAASVYAHEYPGPLTQFFAYGLASVVSISRVAGKEHFPSDVIVGSAMGWLIGREVYKLHHDPDLPGSTPASLSGVDDENQRDRHDMGSPFVALDGWEYSGFERLAALGYVHTGLMGLKPWTRMECARLTDEAAEELERAADPNPEAAKLIERFQKEFAYELARLGGGHNLTLNLESIYARTVSISGPDLSDSYHFGQTISDDFGRPFERGTNLQDGGSFSAAAGPLVVSVRVEYQHAPSAPAYSNATVNAMAAADIEPVSAVPSGPFAAVNRAQLLDAYVGLNLNNWEIVVGRQSLEWSSGQTGSLLWSNNAPAVDMVRLTNPEPVHLPGFLKFFGPVKFDQFFGRLGGRPYVPRPYEYGQKMNFKPFPWLELGFARTVTIGGPGSGAPLNAREFLRSFFGRVDPRIDSIPGDAHTEMDWTFHVPKVRDSIVLYGDWYAEDAALPVIFPRRNPIHPGIYITKFPRLPKLDLHVEGVSTEQADNLSLGVGNAGHFNYFNGNYHDGYTNDGYLIGNAVGRDGTTIQGWLTYWLSERNYLQLVYKNNSVSKEMLPGGGAWQDYALKSEIHLHSGLYVKSEVQYEHISTYPILFTSPQNNVSAILELGFSFRDKNDR